MSEMSRLVRRREVSVVELVEAHLARIDELNPALNAFVAVDIERARTEARAADATVARGEPVGVLHGVPISIKSSISVEDLPWETGSASRRGVRGSADATLVRRLRAAGAIVLGVTNVAEQLMAWETANPLYGRTNSPWSLAHTPGGSSGGESAAIAAGLSAGGVGSDGGGSIRVPAHFTGICGLKPTPGRVPATGHFPPCGGPFALTGVVGPMARTIDDVGLLLSVMAGPDIGDPNGHPVPLGDIATVTPSSFLPVMVDGRFAEPAPRATRGTGTINGPEGGTGTVSAPKRGTGTIKEPGRGTGTLNTERPLRVGYFEDDGRTAVHADIRAAVRRAAEALAAAGVDVVPYRPTWLEEARVLWWEIFGHAARVLLEPGIIGHERDVHPNLVEFIDWTRRASRLTADRLLSVEIERDRLRTRVLQDMDDVPVLLCPVSAIPAFRHGEREWTIDGSRVHYLDAWSYTAWFNLTQNPAVSVPAARTGNGLPIGVQVVARHWEEHVALGVARIIERALGGFSPPPVTADIAASPAS
jgi:Asp-tRNA(Asn)/Glu-tRNA(Gln) amidotransferase A subunit family amidase